MDIQEHREVIGDEPPDTKKYYMATCPNCGGRGWIYDSMGNRYDCTECNATGSVPD